MKKKLHIISQSHIDPVWLWSLKDGISSFLTTMQSACDRLDEFPQFKYTCSATFMYRYLEQVDPKLFQRIQQFVKEKRWEVVGSWEIQVDCNIPSVESYIRQALYAKEYVSEKFSADAISKIGYVPDSFGHNGGLPQILKATGFEAYVFTRPTQKDNPNVPLLFRWQSKESSEVIGIKIPLQYSQSYAATADDIEDVIRTASTECFADNFDCGAFWFGVGNHGGGPTIEHIERILQLQKDDSLPEIIFSTVEEFLADVKSSEAFENLPILEGDLGYVLRGSYSATTEVKQNNRLTENKIKAAETLAIQANIYPQEIEVFRKCWEKICFNQFHDILAGTCVNLSQLENRNRYGAVHEELDNSIFRSAFTIARNVDTKGEKSVIFVANTLPWKRKVLVSYDTFTQPHEVEEITHLENLDGSEKYPIQWLTPDANFAPWGLKWKRLTSIVDIEGMGYKVFRVAAKPLAKKATSIDKENLDNQFKLTEVNEKSLCFLDDYALNSFKTASEKEVLAGAISTVVIEDLRDTWGHDIEKYDTILGTPEVFETELLEDGELVTVVRQKSKWNKSLIIMDVIRYKSTNNIELNFKINWQEQRKILKLSIPTNIKSNNVQVKMSGDVACREADGKEYPCHDWIAISDSEKSFTLVNNGLYSYDANHSTIRMILARSAAMAEHDPFAYTDDRNVSFLDQGMLEHKFLLVADDNDFSNSNIEKIAQEFQAPNIFVQDGGHSGSLAWANSLLSIDAENINVIAITEVQGQLVFRLQEIGGKKTKAEISYKGDKIVIDFNPWQIINLTGDSTLSSAPITFGA